MYVFSGVLLLFCNVNILDNLVQGAVIHAEDLYRLDVVHYNDFHDKFEETSVPFPVCKTNNDSCIGGFARLYHEIMTILKERPDGLLLDAGDTYQGTYWYTLLKWNVTQHFINMLPHDAHAIGNHEFDDEVAGLAPYLAALKAPVLAANIDTSKEPALNGLYQPHVVIERKGRKIGIIGLITTETAKTSNPQGVIFLDPFEAVEREANLLTEKGVDIIIVLSHCGLQTDIDMSKKVGENIDIIVGGHSHVLLWNGTSPSNERISGPYPLMVEAEAKPGHKVMIVTASSSSKYLGNFTALFDSNGELKDFDATPIFLNRSIPEDLKIKSLLEPYKEKLHGMVLEIVGFTEDSMHGSPCGSGECAIGNLAADAFLDAAQKKYETDLPSLAFLLRNMIRGSVQKGNITRGALINSLPFSNPVVTFVLPGRSLIEAFEKCLTVYWSRQPFKGAMMPQVAGMKLTLNTTSGRVVSASVRNGENYEEIDPDKDYQVTTVKFIQKGGNGFQMLKENSRDVKLIGTDAQIIEDYIRTHSPITTDLDNRLTIEN